MSRKYKTSRNFDRVLSKLQFKDKPLYEALLKKMNEILNNESIEHYKNLKYTLKEFKRVHIGHFVLVFKHLKAEDLILFDDFNHHDVIYKK